MNIFRKPFPNPPDLLAFNATAGALSDETVRQALTGPTRMAELLLNLAMQSLIDQERTPEPVETAFHEKRSLSVKVAAYDSDEPPDSWPLLSSAGMGTAQLVRGRNYLKVKSELPERRGQAAAYVGMVFRAHNSGSKDNGEESGIIWVPESVWDLHSDGTGRPIELQRFSEAQFSPPFYSGSPESVMEQPIAQAGLILNSTADALRPRESGPSLGVEVSGGPL